MSAIVRAGYKQTEVGVIPEDWHVKRLGDIATIATGNTPPTRDGANYGDEFLFVSPADLGDEKHVIDTQKRLSKKGFSLSRSFPKDSILFVCIGSTIGKCGVASIELTTNQQINAIFPASAFSTDYLYYTVCAAAPKVRALAGEQAVPIVNKTQFSQTEVSLPPLPEQRAIATALSDVDTLLAKLDQFIAKKRDLKQATMQQLLTGQTRLPGFSGEWEVKRLGDVSAMGSGGTPTSSVSAYYDGDYPWVSISDMTKGGKVITRTDRNLSVDGLANSAAQIFPAGTVLYAMYASLGECSIAGMPLCTSQAILGIRPQERLNGDFLYYYLNSLKSAVKSMGQQGTQANLNKGMVQAFQLGLPSANEQTAIATILSDMDTELAALEARRDKTRALKQGMMQELLTGRIRLI
jgi:type I restriction enzyme, S subunit